MSVAARLAAIALSVAGTPRVKRWLASLCNFNFWEVRRLLMKLHRSEEHTSELQSHSDLVCRLLLEKKKHEELTVHGIEQEKSWRCVELDEVRDLLRVVRQSEERRPLAMDMAAHLHVRTAHERVLIH